MKKAITMLILSVLIVSCTTTPYSQWRSASEKVVDLINHPGEEYLEDITSKHFLFDRELIVLDKDISLIWFNLNNSEFAFTNGEITETIPVGPDDYKYFADTMEVKTFFKKYLPEDASLVKIQSSSGLYYLLLGSSKYIYIDKKVDFDRPLKVKWFRTRDLSEYIKRSGKKVKYPIVYGFKGPVK